MHAVRQTLVVVAVNVLLAGTTVAGDRSGAVSDEALRARAEPASAGPISVATTVLGDAESQDRFGAPLARGGVQPVWIQVRNGSGAALVLNFLAVDPDYFSPAEVAERSPVFAGDPGAPARRLDFYRAHFPFEVPAGETATGFVYANLDPGRKAYTVELIGDESIHSFEFVVAVPGFEADFARVDFDALYAPAERRDVTLDELRAYLASLPCCVLGGDRKTPGDPLNLVVVGSPPHVLATFSRRGWDMTETVTAGAALRTAASSVFGSRYRTSPISGLYLFDRPQDVGLQKARETVDERNHLRLWLAPVRLDGQSVWVGQISRDVGVKLSSKTLVTHRIDPVVDEARTYAVLDLVNSGYVSAVGYAAGVSVSRIDAPRMNYTLDPYVTDGLRAMLVLSESTREFSDITWIDWETPPARSDGFVAEQ